MMNYLHTTHIFGGLAFQKINLYTVYIQWQLHTSFWNINIFVDIQKCWTCGIYPEVDVENTDSRHKPPSTWTNFLQMWLKKYSWKLNGMYYEGLSMHRSILDITVQSHLQKIFTIQYTEALQERLLILNLHKSAIKI